MVGKRATGHTSNLKLTPREAEIVEKIVQGKANKDIANDLGCSRKTIEVHATNAFRKFGVKSRLELACKLLGAPPSELLSRRDSLVGQRS